MATRIIAAQRGKRTKAAPVAPADHNVAHQVSLSGAQEFDAAMAFNAIESNCAAIANILEPHIGMTYPCTNDEGIEIRFSVLALNSSVLAAESRLWAIVFPDKTAKASAAEASHE